MQIYRQDPVPTAGSGLRLYAYSNGTSVGNPGSRLATGDLAGFRFPLDRLQRTGMSLGFESVFDLAEVRPGLPARPSMSFVLRFPEPIDCEWSGDGVHWSLISTDQVVLWEELPPDVQKRIDWLEMMQRGLPPSPGGIFWFEGLPHDRVPTHFENLFSDSTTVDRMTVDGAEPDAPYRLEMQATSSVDLDTDSHSSVLLISPGVVPGRDLLQIGGLPMLALDPTHSIVLPSPYRLTNPGFALDLTVQAVVLDRTQPGGLASLRPVVLGLHDL